MDDDADRCFDGEGNAIDQGVGDADRLDGEGAEGELLLRRDLDERGFVEELVLFEFAFDVGQRELGGVDGNLELAEDPGQSADVVLVAMGEDDGANVFPVFREVGDVGHDDVDAQQSDSGNMRPASMTMMSSSQRRARQFIPNSPSPPRGMILSLFVCICQVRC